LVLRFLSLLQPAGFPLLRALPPASILSRPPLQSASSPSTPLGSLRRYASSCFFPMSRWRSGARGHGRSEQRVAVSERGRQAAAHRQRPRPRVAVGASARRAALSESLSDAPHLRDMQERGFERRTWQFHDNQRSGGHGCPV